MKARTFIELEQNDVVKVSKRFIMDGAIVHLDPKDILIVKHGKFQNYFVEVFCHKRKTKYYEGYLTLREGDYEYLGLRTNPEVSLLLSFFSNGEAHGVY